jgi:hypothetical protein
MTNLEEIPRGSTAVIDSSVLFAMGGPDNAKYQTFQRFITHRDISVYIPSQVAEELGESPDGYTFHRERLQAAQEAGWLERGDVDYENPAVSRAIDRTRKRMLNISSEDVSEDEIEKADTVLAGLAYQYASKSETQVTVFVSDSVAEQAIRDVLSAIDIGDQVRIVEGRQFIQELVDDRL